MKKFILVLIVALISFPIFMSADKNNAVSKNLKEAIDEEQIEADLGKYKENDDKVNVYLFRGNGCGFCRSFLEYASSTLVKDYGDYFNLISYEVWYNQDNQDLMNEVVDYLNVGEKIGVPFIVVGDKYFIGFGDDTGTQIVEAIKAQFDIKPKKRTDVVKDVLNGVSKDDKETSDGSNASVIVMMVICTLSIIGVYVFKSNNDRKILLDKIDAIKEKKK